MLSLVNYGASDSEDNISDEEEVVIASKVQQNGNNKNLEDNTEDTEDLNDALESTSIINLPQPVKTRSNQIIEEDDDEFLHKKEVPEIAPPPPAPKAVKQKVKITIPKLSDFKDEEDEKDLGPKYPTASNRKTGLLNLLPKPAHSSAPINKPSIPVPSKPPQVVQKNVSQDIKPQTSISDSSSNPQDSKKKIGFIPYALMDHKKTADESKKSSKKKSQDSDDSDEEAGSSFFSFNTKDEDLPKVSEDEIKAMINKEANRLEERKKQAEQSEEIQYEEQDYSQQYYQEQQQSSIDEDAMKALVGGSKAKRLKLNDIQIVDLSDRDVLPDKEEWSRKNLAGETSYLATGRIDDKGPSALAKRKHQISYLSVRAEKNMAELEAMWAANRQSNREGRSKYGF
ncbi:proline-rich protein PRCC [Chironomus tepperi]|uniref:proline-rich protein PRCC n=1 Tax=Chironomus tepperi TaxID=113505 RepID=UPI00391FB5DF